MTLISIVLNVNIPVGRTLELKLLVLMHNANTFDWVDYVHKPITFFFLFFFCQLLEEHVPGFCKYLSVSTLVPLILSMFVDMATANPRTFVDHVTSLKQLAEQQPVYIHQVVQIIGATGTVSQVIITQGIQVSR